MKLSHQKKAQQVVEFLLIAPFIIAFLALFTEYGYALNINLTLTKALKNSTAKIYQYARPDMTKEDLINQVKTDLIQELKSNYIPVQDENKINVSFVKKEKIAIVMARYTYIPAFSLPAIFFKIMPDKFDFMTTSAIPVTLLKQNKFSGVKTSLELDEIWSATNFSDIDSFDGKKYGIWEEDNGKRNKILFLLPCEYFKSVIGENYALVNWNGEYIKSGDTYFIYTKSNSKLQLCKPADGEHETFCETGSVSVFDYLNSNNIHYVYVVNDTSASKATITLNSLSSYWNQTSTEGSGMLKRIISLTDTSGKTIGNYDNINTGESKISSYKEIGIHPFGSMIFIDNSEEIRNNITSGKSKPAFMNFEG